jgi:hypothetical protein
MKKYTGAGLNAEFLNMHAYYLKYEYREKDMAWGISMIILCILLILICLVLNTTVFVFYKKKAKEDVVSLLYSMLSSVDILVALGSCLTVICLILYLSMDLKTKEMDFVSPSIQYLCYFSFFIASVAIRISIFLNAMLSIVRTMMIRNPFSEPNKKGVCIALGVMSSFWIIMTAGEIYTQEKVNIKKHWEGFERDLKQIPLEEDKKNRKQYLYMWYFIYTSAAGFYHFAEFLSDRLPWSIKVYSHKDKNAPEKLAGERFSLYGQFLIAFVIPCFIAIACLIVKAFYLKKPKIGGTENNSNRKVTNTIVMLTIVFVICNSINIVVISIAMWYEDWIPMEQLNSSSISSAQEKAMETDSEDSQIRYITKEDDVIMRFYRTMFTVQQVLPLLNSTLSPMILIWRGTALRSRFVGYCNRVLSWGRRSNG